MSDQALPRDSAAAPRRHNRFIQWFDGLVIRVTDRAPSNRVLVSVLVISMLTLLFMGATGGKPRGTTTPFDSVDAPVASAAAESRASATMAAPTAAGREEGRFAPTIAMQPPIRSESAASVAPAGAIETSGSFAARAGVVSVAPTRVIAEGAPRVIDMTRSEPPPPQVASEIVRAEPLAARAVDAPRTESAIGATSRASVETTVSFPPAARVRDVAESLPPRDEAPKAPRAAERTIFDPSLNPGL